MSKDNKYIPLITVKEKTETEPAEFIELCTAPCDKGAKITVENEPATKDYVDSLMKKLESRFESIEKQMIENNKQK